MSDAFKNILIIKPSSLGDIVLALPALTALRKSFPHAEITWLVRPEFAPLLTDHPDLTGIIPFDRKYLGKAWFHPGAFAALVSLLYRLYRTKFDVVFDFQGLFRTAFMALVSGCKKRFGMADARELAHVLYTHKVPRTPDCIHLVDYYLEMTRAAGASDLTVRFTLPSVPAAEDSLAELLAAHDLAPKEYAVLIAGSAHADKCWPVRRFAALGQKISREHNLSIVAAGSTAEAHLVENLVELSNVPIINLAGQTSIGELIALLRAARLVVCNDTGPAHMAAALGTPIVMIFGRSNPARVGPYGRKNCVVAIDPDGRGLSPNSSDPKHDVTAITLDEVYHKVLQQITT